MMSLTGRCIGRLLHAAALSSARQAQISKFGQPVLPVRQFTLSACRHDRLELGSGEEKDDKSSKRPEGKRGHRVKEVSLQESLKYMQSEAFKLIYGDEPVWKYYRRNFKGHYAPKPRVQCVRKGVVETASPCPLCRDDYLIVSYKNTQLLKQFVSELNGEPLEPKMTGLCMKQHKHVKLEVARAQDYGLMEKGFHFRKYDYDYYNDLANSRTREMIEFLSSGAPDAEASTPTEPTEKTEPKPRAETPRKSKSNAQAETKAESKVETPREIRVETKVEIPAEIEAESTVEQTKPRPQDKDTGKSMDSNTERVLKPATGKVTKNLLKGREEKQERRERREPSKKIVHARVKQENKQDVMSDLLKDKYNLK